MQFKKQYLREGKNKFILLFLGILIFLILFGIFLRFFKITEMGVYGSDNLFYINIAKAWSEGNFVYQIAGGRPVFRPVIYCIYAGAIHIFGFHDYSIKMMNVFIDSLSIFLMMFISYRLSDRNLWASLSAGIIYALLPIAITYSRIELTHTISAFMVLMSFLFFLIYFQSDQKKKKYLFLILTGIFTGLTALSHEELVFIAPGYILFLFIHFLSQPRNVKTFIQFVLDSSLYLATTFVICQNIIYLYLSAFIGKLKTGVSDTSVDSNAIERIFIFIWNGISTNTSTIFLWLFLLLGFVLVILNLFKWLKFKKLNIKFPLLYYLPWLIVFGYTFFYAHLTSVLISRLFLPFVPLIIIALVIGYEKIFKNLSIKFSNSFLIIIGTIIIFFNLGHYSEFTNISQKRYSLELIPPTKYLDLDLPGGYKRFKNRNYKKKWERQIFEKLKDRVNENARLLITSSIIYPTPGRRVFQLGFYFGDNAIYIIDHSEPLEDLISKYKVKYLIYTLLWADKRVIKKNKSFCSYKYNGKWSISDSNQLGKSYGFDPGEFTVKKEYIFLKKFLKRKKATPIFTNGNIKKSMKKFSKSKGSICIYGDFIIYKFGNGWINKIYN